MTTPGSPLPAGPHRRYNPLLDEWVLVSPHRLERPWQGQVEGPQASTLPAYDPGCYLCPGNLRAGGERNPAYAATYVFDNDFPALLPDAPASTPAGDELFVTEAQSGRCRVVCFSPRHDLTLAQMDGSGIRAVVDTWADEVDRLARAGNIQYVQVFENKGAAMGCSNPHPHCQIWASATVPHVPARKLAMQRRYMERHGRDLVGDCLARELAMGDRVVCRNDAWVVVVPFWAVWPFETMVIPVRHVDDLRALESDERDQLADILRRLAVRYDNLFQCSFPYSMGWHGRPVDDQAYPGCRLHAVYFPPLLRSATVRKFLVGYEMTAEPQRDLTAESAAARLRSQSEVHYLAPHAGPPAKEVPMRTVLRSSLFVFLFAGFLASAPMGAPAPGTPAQTPAQIADAARAITAPMMLSHVTALAADDKAGRAPGTAGEERTVAYLVAQFKRIGLAPGNPDGTYVQRVPLIGFTGQATAAFDVGGSTSALAVPDEAVVVSRQGMPDVTVSKSPMVFVGYGVIAPEFGWDDFKGVDVRGKTIVMLAGDPPVPDPANPAKLDANVFKGAALTYYGRWTYKYEMAAKKGASAAIIVHETGPAGYAFDVVKASWGRENFGLSGQDEAARHAAVDAWLTLDRAKALFTACGLDYDALKARAATRGFRPVPLKAAASFTVKNAIRTISSRNVIARLEGRDPALKHEHVMYSAHWDGFGTNPALQGDQILNGALDNGSGMATMLAIAEAFTKLEGGTTRSVLFFSPTAEESAMLGAKHYAEHPLWPLETTLADINMDIMNFWGRTKAIVSIGYGMTTLDDLLAFEAAKQGRIVLPDPEAEKGYFYRSDHFELARQGVPALHFLHPGADYRDRPADYGQRMRDRYTAEDYHKVSDDVKADWDLGGAVEDAQLLFGVGLAVAQGSAYPEWKPGTEFRAIRAARLKAK